MKRISIITLVFMLSATVTNAEWKAIFTQMGNKNVWAGIEVFDENSISMTGVMDNMGNSQPILGYSSDGQNVSMGQPPQNTDAQMSIFFFLSGAGTNGFLAGMSLLKGFPPPIIIDVAKSTNKGKNFSLQKGALPGSKNMSASAIYFSDPMTGWIVGGGDKTYYLASTKDAGATWEENTTFYAFRDKISVNNIFFINDRVGWIVGGDNGERNKETGEYTRNPSSGFIAVSTDGGKTFKNIYENSNFTINAVHFVDCQIGIIAGYDAAKAYVLYTSDGGKTFTQSSDLKIPYGSKTVDAGYVSALQLLNSKDGFLGANYITDPSGESCAPAVFKTSDGGKSWVIDDTYSAGLTGIARYACIYGMKFYSEKVGYLVGQHLLVAKYTNENGSSENHRCVECMLGKCHRQEVPDAGPDVVTPDIVYPDGETPDTIEDTGTVITCPSDKILPMTDSRICFSNATESSISQFKANIGFAEIINGTSFVAYIIGEKEGMTLAEARDAANNKTEDVDYIRLSISPSMKVSEMYGFSKIKFVGSNISAQIVYDDLYQILKIKGLEADIMDSGNQKKGGITMNLEVPVLTARQLSNASLNLIDEICNLNRQSCQSSIEDTGVIIGEDGEIINPDGATPSLDAHSVSDGSKGASSSDGCSCTTLF